MVPILYKPVPDEAIPEAVAKYQRIDFTGNDDFDLKFVKLIAALDTDLEWVEALKQLLVRSRHWERKAKDRSLLLRGAELREAEQLMDTGTEKEPKPTVLHSQYILASRQSANELQRIIISVVAAAFFIAMGLAIYAFTQRNLAQREAKEAEDQSILANTNAAEATREKKAAEDNAAEATEQRNRAVQNAKEAKRQEDIANKRLLKSWNIPEFVYDQQDQLKGLHLFQRNYQQDVNSLSWLHAPLTAFSVGIS